MRIAVRVGLGLLFASSGAAALADMPDGFRVCSVCHATTAGRASLGPNLAGVAGRPAGSLAGYVYSPAMKAFGKTWDKGTLDAFLTNPSKVVPHNKMPFAGVTDPAKREEIVKYLLGLK